MPPRPAPRPQGPREVNPAMTWSGATLRLSFIIGLTGFLVYFMEPMFDRLRTLGVFRSRTDMTNMHGLAQLKAIPNTLQCEDSHYYAPTGELFALCQTGNDRLERYGYFPPLLLYSGAKEFTGRGTIVTVDTATHQSTPLELKDFSGPFATHGFDVYAPTPEDPKADIFFLAVNHLPNQAYWHPAPGTKPNGEKTASQIELFRHTPGSKTATHVRSIAHPLIRTPNDIFAVSETEFYVTNDHRMRQGNLRLYEDVFMGWAAITSDVVHVKFDVPATKPAADAHVNATVALAGEHNPNGLGHGSSLFPEEVTLTDAAGGGLHRLKRDIDPSATDVSLKHVETRWLDSAIDNPSFFEDPYPDVVRDASGYVLAGMARGFVLADDVKNLTVPLPVLGWHVPLTAGGKLGKPRQLFQDNGIAVRGSSSGVLVAIDPKTNAGKKEAWLFVTGFVTENMVVTKVDLSVLGGDEEEEVVGEEGLGEGVGRDEL